MVFSGTDKNKWYLTGVTFQKSKNFNLPRLNTRETFPIFATQLKAPKSQKYFKEFLKSTKAFEEVK